MSDSNSDFLLIGSICLTDIPRELIKAVTCKDGVVRKYLNISIGKRRTEQTFTNSNGKTRTLTHYVSCAPKKDERVDGVNYFIGDLETYTFNGAPAQQAAPRPQNNAPANDPDVPF